MNQENHKHTSASITVQDWLTISWTNMSFTSDRTASCTPERVFLPRTRRTFDPVTILMGKKSPMMIYHQSYVNFGLIW